jgi:hypothetical protein
MRHGTRGRRGLGRRWGTRGIASGLVGLSLWGCGARAQAGLPGAASDAGASPIVTSESEPLPARFDVLTLGRILNVAEVASDTECDPTVQVTNIELNRGTRRLTVSTCERVPGSSRYVVERTRRTLGDSELDRVQDAYRELRVQEGVGCNRGEATLTLDVQPPSGPLLRFADEDLAACRGAGEPHTNAVVGLEELYALLLRLGSAG